MLLWTASVPGATGLLPDLSVGWKIRMGDDVAWKERSIDEADWKPIEISRPWEDQGFPDHDGYAWYRVHFRIPAALQRHPEFLRHEALRVELGKIDDVDQTWFNGTLIGATGRFPDSYAPNWLASRAYLVPAELIRWNDDNVLAVRVYDGAGPGGMYEGVCRLAVAGWADFVRTTFELGGGNGVFTNAGQVPVAVAFSNGTRFTISGELNWIVQTDERRPISTHTVAATLPPGVGREFQHAFDPPDPGFYRVTCAFRSEQSAVTNSTAITLGYRPEEMRSALTREPDFDEFWRTTLARLAATDPEFTLTARSSMDSGTHEVYELTMRSLDGVRVGGWYEKPTAPGVHPAIIRVPGYGEDLRPTGRSSPLAILSFNIRGHGNSQQDVKGTPRDYWIRGLGDQNGYFYQGAYADCVRAVDFLVSRPEVDQRRIGITGASQGGGLSLATAALDPRIRLCAPDIPFLCDWRRYFRTTLMADQWPEVDAWIQADGSRSLETALRTMSYFDTLNLADRIRCPVFLSVGLQDDVCPPATIFAVYNRISAPKEFRVYPQAQHWVGATHDQERFQWIHDHFNLAQ